jgi:FemAB-related protein (PEP-CTERM system-associated)
VGLLTDVSAEGQKTITGPVGPTCPSDREFGDDDGQEDLHGREGRLSVTVAGALDRAAWDAFVSRSVSRSAFAKGQDVSGYHEWAWRDVFERTFGHACIYLVARRNDRVEGVLPLVEIRSRLFGRSITSLPFVNYGGVLSESRAAARALLDAAAAIARERRSPHIELRHIGQQFIDLPCKQHKVAMLLRLQPGLWDRLDRKVRNQVRKAQKSDLAVERGQAELLEAFYAVFARNMRDLGTPVYPKRFFEEVLRAFPTRARLIVVKLGNRPVAAALTYRTANTIEVPWASSIRDYNKLCPNALLYWSMLDSALAEGCDVFDFGRSTPNEGTFKFKEQWGATAVPLHWEYYMMRQGVVPDHSPKNPKFRLAIAAWKRCPLWLANAVGPMIVRSIP